MNSDELQKYPVGRYSKPETITTDYLKQCISAIEAVPAELNRLLLQVNESNAGNTYREGGWSIRQIVHHLADSHTNAFFRCKLALTEDTPQIKPYSESKWAEEADYSLAPLSSSAQIVSGIHARWVVLLNSLSEADFEKAFYHPEYKKQYAIKDVVSLYAWHGRHHLEHIKAAVAGSR